MSMSTGPFATREHVLTRRTIATDSALLVHNFDFTRFFVPGTTLAGLQQLERVDQNVGLVPRPR